MTSPMMTPVKEGGPPLSDLSGVDGTRLSINASTVKHAGMTLVNTQPQIEITSALKDLKQSYA